MMGKANKARKIKVGTLRRKEKEKASTMRANDQRLKRWNGQRAGIKAKPIDKATIRQRTNQRQRKLELKVVRAEKEKRTFDTADIDKTNKENKVRNAAKERAKPNSPIPPKAKNQT